MMRQLPSTVLFLRLLVDYARQILRCSKCHPYGRGATFVRPIHIWRTVCVIAVPESLWRVAQPSCWIPYPAKRRKPNGECLIPAELCSRLP
ncbi:hypothetical protein KCP69_19880 [Salmonella enterica subsp. enterica]|nr:hypothetical protein KCP69_19880 [Salmonella enterica subsp. enterica]